MDEMNLSYEKELIEFDAEFAFGECIKRAETRHLELDYVVSEFLKVFNKLAKDNSVN